MKSLHTLEYLMYRLFKDDSGELWHFYEIFQYWADGHSYDPSLMPYNSFDEWFEESLKNGYYKPMI